MTSPKVILVIPPIHSLIDVITNSSSEMFITDNTTTLSAVQEYLQDIPGVGDVYEVNKNTILKFIQESMNWVGSSYGISLQSEWDWVNLFAATHKISLHSWNNTPDDIHNRSKMNILYDEYRALWMKENLDKVLKINQGRIVIHSSDDNSISWEDMEEIEFHFGAARYHLG